MTRTPQLGQDHAIFLFAAADTAFSGAVCSSVDVVFGELMSVDAMCFGCVVVAAPGNHVFHVLLLCAAFKVMWIHADRVVAFMSYDFRKVQVGEVKSKSVCAHVAAESVGVAIRITSSCALPYPAFFW